MSLSWPAIRRLRAMATGIVLMLAPIAAAYAGPSMTPPASPTAARPGPATSAVEPDIEHFPGYELEGDNYKLLAAPSYRDCAAFCAEDPRCRALEYYIDKRGCGLFETVPAKRRRAGVDTGVVLGPPDASTPELRRLRRRFVEGAGYETIGGSSFEDCSRRCQNDARCRMLEFYKPKQKCNLFDHQRARRSSDDDAEVAVKQ